MQRHTDHFDNQLLITTQKRGLSILECLIATMILSIVVLSLAPVLSAGRSNLEYGEMSIRGIRIGEHLLEEIHVRDYSAIGSTRKDWGLDDYHGFSDTPGAVTDFAGTLYDMKDQIFTRSVAVNSDSVVLPELGGITVDGKRVTITINGPHDNEWVLTKFIREPHTP
tara:strand:+ start:17084 stop:17584 length:501 start_codon:yes stop_codon:yes gene_type:complete